MIIDQLLGMCLCNKLDDFKMGPLINRKSKSLGSAVFHLFGSETHTASRCSPDCHQPTHMHEMAAA